MNLALSAQQQHFQQIVREFAVLHVQPFARELDETGKFPHATFRQAAALGLAGMAVPQRYGGAGLDPTSYSIAIEEISRACASTGAILLAQNSLFADAVLRFGTEAQKQKFLLPFARGERIGCSGFAEPQLRSNAAALSTPAGLPPSALRRGDSYLVNGTTAWMINGGVADAALVYVRTDPAQGENGITALFIERGTPGLRIGEEEKKLGIRAAACTQLSFTECEVPVENRLGGEGEGYRIAQAALDGARIGIAAQAVGIAQGAFEYALAYAQQQALVHAMGDSQAIQFMLAEMATEIDAARLLVHKAAWKHGSGSPFTTEASVAKFFASETATRVTHKAMQILGDCADSREHPVERMYRDACVTELYGGTAETQRSTVASWVLHNY